MTYRKLVWMDTARSREAWYHTARLCALTQNLLAAWCSSVQAKAEKDYHPEGAAVYRRAPIQHAPPPTEADRALLRGLFRATPQPPA